MLTLSILMVGTAAIVAPMALRRTHDAEAIAPTIISSSPSNGPTAGGTTVTITGSDFLPTIGDMTDISSGWRHSCGIYQGKAYCWGYNNVGQLGNGTASSGSNVPVPAATSVMSGTVTAVAAGVDHTCAIANNKAYLLLNNPAATDTTATPGGTDTTKIWYGMNVDMSKPTGKYTTTVMYTVIAN